METLHLFSLPRTAKWRAKLCRLGYENWQVFGEGNVFGEFDAESGEYSLTMEDQYDPSRILFRSTIRAPVAFQKQEALLLWNGPEEDVKSEEAGGSNGEFWQDENGLARVALAFQVVPGCALMSEFVLYAISQLDNKQDVAFAVQQSGHLADCMPAMAGNSLQLTMERCAELVEEPIKYPPMPTRHNLTIVHNTIANLLKSNLGRELLIVFFATKNYLTRLWTVYQEILPVEAPASDDSIDNTNRKDTANKPIHMSPLERIQLLWSISDIVKQYMTSGDALLIDRIVDYDVFVKVLSMLEYDRSFGTRKANFRDYYCRQTGMKQVIEMVDSPVLEKIQRTFRLQMLRDVLVRSSDDVTFSILRNLININQADILENLQNSPDFCDELFSLFISSDGHPLHQTMKARDDAVEFINEVMKTSKAFPIAQLKPLYLRLLESGLVSAVAYGLHPERRCEIKLLTLETLSIIFEFDTTLILPTHGTTILQAIVSMVYDVQLCGPDAAALPSKIRASTRAVQLESCDLLKKILTDFPQETYARFFEFIELALTRSVLSADNIERLLPILDILTHCFSLNPELTGGMMIEYNIWDQISRNTAMDPQQLRLVMNSKLYMGLIRLVREAIQPPLVIATFLVAKQAIRITESGLLQQIISRVCAKPRVNDAEHSSFLSLLNVIVNGRNNSSAKQFKVIVNWLISSGAVDLKQLCTVYPLVKSIIPEHILESILFDSDDHGGGRRPRSTKSLTDESLPDRTLEEELSSCANHLSEWPHTGPNGTVQLKRTSSQNIGSDVDNDGPLSRRPKLGSASDPDVTGSVEPRFENSDHSRSHLEGGSHGVAATSAPDSDEVFVISSNDFSTYAAPSGHQRHSICNEPPSLTTTGRRHPWWDSSHALSPRNSLESDELSRKALMLSPKISSEPVSE